MRTAMLMPLACLVVHAGDPWAEAQAEFRKGMHPGFIGCLIYVERLDAQNLRLRVQAQETRFGFLEGEPVGYPTHAFKVRAPRGASDLRLITVVPEGATAIRLRLQGDEVSPEVLVRLPKPGESEGVVLQFEVAQGGPLGALKSK
jgi:hypothetical protein